MPMEAPCCNNAMDFVSTKVEAILQKYIQYLPPQKQKEIIKDLVKLNPRFVTLIDSLPEPNQSSLPQE